MNELETWLAAAGAELGVPPGDVPSKELLDVARGAGHGLPDGAGGRPRC
jgi:hypothetical protein